MSRAHTPLPDGLTYSEFFDYYLREHRLARTRYVHYLGTTLGILFLLATIVTGKLWLIPIGAIIAYSCAWFGHFFIERNKPAAFKYPFWSLISDFRMLGLAATGRIDAALTRAGVDVTSPAGRTVD